MKYYLYKMKNLIVTLRVSILTVFIALFVMGFLTLIGISYLRSSASMSYAALKLMQQTSATVFHDIVEDELNPVEFEARFAGELAEQGVIDSDDFKEWINYTVDLVKRSPMLQVAYWSDETGSIVIAIEESDGSVTTEIIDRHHVPATHQYIYRDLKGNILKSVSSNDFSYDPRPRPWYQKAKLANQLVWTDVYLYKPTNLLGITAAVPVHKNGKIIGVFGLNLSLDYLSKAIEHEKIGTHGIVYIVTQSGKLVAFPNLKSIGMTADNLHHLIDIHTFQPAWLASSFDLYKKTLKNKFNFKVNGINYLATYTPIPIIQSEPWIVGIVVPEDDFITELKRTHVITTLVGVLILILGIFLMSFLVNKIANPLRRLVKEAEKIKHFELNDNVYIRSRIKEVLHLSEAIYAMKKGLRSFQRYVPSDLVRQLIETGEDARVGGSKKPLAIFFSDIKGFTSIVESMEPNQLMGHVCEYLDAMSKIIIEQRGTIDKYMGDAIMAFWGAPFPQENSCHRAAAAALFCQQRLADLNNEWQSQGKPCFYTRIGIHFGEAIVGNLGSAERLNYTAIGDVINVGNRIEGLNKIYGSKIIVSDAVYQQINNQFILRKLDCVEVKGKSEAIYIYELLAEKGTQLTFHINEYSASFEQGFSAYQEQHWDEAIRYFDRCLVIYPTDKVAPVFIKRCKKFKLAPPLHWDGIWHLDKK